MTLFLAQRPEDFRVTEVPLGEPEGAGPHTYLWLEKTATTTEAVALALARVLGVHSREIGYAGRKDRNAIARQWFSVPRLEPERALALILPGVRVLRSLRGREKLRTGQLKANRFALRVRSSADANLDLLRGRAEQLRRDGVPNRFGGQRFGGDGDNAARGRELLHGRRRRRGHRDDRFFLSAWQSLLFNRVLAERPAIGALEAGDIAYDHRDGRNRSVLDPSAHAEEV
ncbi:MAG: tRNA pseudouridine(13) synthase TruD, partial [Myxococcales bacterium]|nr:tRNA pseudouridine(13) synthase TruD [Myxococcales bacterium]